MEISSTPPARTLKTRLCIPVYISDIIILFKLLTLQIVRKKIMCRCKIKIILLYLMFVLKKFIFIYFLNAKVAQPFKIIATFSLNHILRRLFYNDRYYIYHYTNIANHHTNELANNCFSRK